MGAEGKSPETFQEISSEDTREPYALLSLNSVLIISLHFSFLLEQL